MSEPLVTVILPSLNVKKYIKACMDSVVNQSLQALEILCIDAGSTDGTLEILKEYALSDQRIKIIHSEVKSYGMQINMGFELARGKYVAVVETDDYIDLSMYEKLYAVAEENRLDFVKADFMGVRMLRSGKLYCDEGRVWPNDELYGKVISAEDYPELYVRDVNIWKGLYNRQFLMNNKIRLNETPGAAFQDIGFCHLLLLYAKRGMYIKDMLYFYRRDNGGASSVQPWGLCYAYQEYKRLCAHSVDTENARQFYHYLFVRMAYVFMGEYEKLLYYDKWKEEEFREAVGWFKATLGEAIEKSEIACMDIGTGNWERLLQLIDSEDEFAAEWHRNQEKKAEAEKNLLNKIGEEKIVIFGCGRNGDRCFSFCDEHNIAVAMFCDNNSALWGKRHHGYEVCCPAELTGKYSGMKVLISTSKYEKDIQNQLAEAGVKEDHIILWRI